MLIRSAINTRACSESSGMSSTAPAATQAGKSPVKRMRVARPQFESWQTVLNVSLRHISRGSHQKSRGR
eukprot:7390753-Prymnesium_polylepis.2